MTHPFLTRIDAALEDKLPAAIMAVVETGVMHELASEVAPELTEADAPLLRSLPYHGVTIRSTIQSLGPERAVLRVSEGHDRPVMPPRNADGTFKKWSDDGE